MNVEEIPYNPPGTEEFIRAGAAHNQRLLEKWAKEESASTVESERRPVVNGRLIIVQTSKPGKDAKMVRAYLPANPGGVRKAVGVSASTTGNIGWAVTKCAAKAFHKLNGGEVEEIETRCKIEPHPQPDTWLVNLQAKDEPQSHGVTKGGKA